ncbi:RagB/SusD family nutrient uptake outer membrane protein [Puteibacter caeruleilacunae]|nr:RagB/SusD family nutrient uptake outer membrane protein [Puteibacter caeruleilacunae]
MKKSYSNIIWLLTIAVCTFSCDDSFLDRVPQDTLSEGVYFTDVSHLEAYVNGLYVISRYDYGDNGTKDQNSDIQLDSHEVTSNLYTKNNTGIADISNSTWDNTYDKIRAANYFLVNYEKVGERDDIANQYIGEAYYWRANQYFKLLKTFGGVPIIDEPLATDDIRLYSPRASRQEVVDFILTDLDSAIVNMSWHLEGAALSGRVNKETAMTIKSRVALYEGTWERYHGAKGTPFAVAGSDGAKYLNIVAPTLEDLIARQGDNIFKSGDEPYNQFLAQDDASKVPGAFFYAVYINDIMEKSNNFYSMIGVNGRSVTRRLVDQYLDKDGIPQSASNYDLVTLTEKSQNLDPRFRQSIYTPDRGRLIDIPGRTSVESRYPYISAKQTGKSSTGFRRYKGAVNDATQYRAGETDEILIRYGEALLNYAEAKAILGIITQDDLDKTVNVLRDRINMTHMDLAAVNSWDVNYDPAFAFNPSETNVVNEIRRERTVELAFEGFRLNDLKRWAAFEDAINGWKPEGANAEEFVYYFNSQDPTPAITAKNDGVTNVDELDIEQGTDFDILPSGNIWPLFKEPEFQPNGEGFGIVASRDYLSSIPSSEIDLYKENGVDLIQNPGWK